VGRLLEDAGAARETGRRALGCAEARRGAGARALAEVRELHSRSVPWYRPAMPWMAAGRLLARPLGVGAAAGAQGASRGSGSWTSRVIGVGNLTMGGTGKTPACCSWPSCLRRTAVSRGF